jgi:hypothetical protein
MIGLPFKVEPDSRTTSSSTSAILYNNSFFNIPPEIYYTIVLPYGEGIPIVRYISRLSDDAPAKVSDASNILSKSDL